MKAPAGVLLVLLVGCAPAPSRRIEKLFGGPDNFDIVASPERVEAFRLRPPFLSEKVDHYNQWPVQGGAVRVPADVAARFSRGLTSESTYPRWEDAKACDPRPGFMLRFTADGRHVDVVFCFECAILFTYRGPESIWYANFDESTRAIASLFLQVFPRDPSLSRLVANETP
ncbi:MAG TPA: hypothetical protein VG457_15445 [Planctomycetota bacterium]|jgi:hypothetical protein|nr:hypothetical protein [Planctomycetota bacterium]